MKTQHQHHFRINTLLTHLLTAFGRYIYKYSGPASTSIAQDHNEELLGNIAEGTHAGAITRRADAAIAARFSLVKVGSDAEHIAVTGVSDVPLGFCLDEATAAEDIVAIGLLGASHCTHRAIASGGVSAGDFLVPGASGTARTLPASAGTYYIIGRALTSVSSGELVELDPTIPVQRIVS